MSERTSSVPRVILRRSEHGAVLVNVGIMIFGLVAFGTFVTDSCIPCHQTLSLSRQWAPFCTN